MEYNSLNINTNLLDKYNDIQKLSKKECQELLNKINIKDAISNENKNHLINYILISYSKSKDKALEQLKRERIFSLSIDSKNKFIIKILDFLIKNYNKFYFFKKDLAYFKSKYNLAFFSDNIYITSQKIRKFIKNSKSSFVRDILYIVDMEFYYKKIKLNSVNTNIEQLSEVCSSLIYLYSKINKEHIISEKTFSSINILNNKELINIISEAYKIKDFQNIEKLIDNFNYNCTKKRNNLIINNQDTLLAKSRIYGDIHSNMQRLAYNLHNVELYKDALSFNNLIEKSSNNIQDLFEFNEYGIERYIFHFPQSDEIKKIIIKDEYFLEEILELKEINKEYGLKEDLMSFKISKTLTIKDLIIIRRIYTIIANLNSKFLYSILEKDKTKKQIVYNSWIKAVKYENLKNTLVSYIGNNKAEEFISEFSWFLEKKEKLDLQFTPLIKSDDYYLPLNIFIGSNLFRNSLFKNKIRPQKINQNDLISQNITTVLKKNFQYVESEVKFKKYGYEGDFDVIAYIDNVIYLFECKNTITPTDLHELRTTKDNIEKGFEQLTKCRDAFSDKKFLEYIKNKLNWNITNDFKIVTCVVLGTRMFNGYTNNTHHVRASHELVNFLGSGIISIENNDRVEEVFLWKEEKINGNDIYNFIENRVLHKLIFKSFSPQDNKYSLGNYNLVFETFEFELNTFHKELKANFKTKKA